MSSSMSPRVDSTLPPLADGTPTARVLVVDDVEANRALVTALLTRDGYRVEAAATGDAALESVRRDPRIWCCWT
jgi:CheY-like chemotaxis protein